MRRLRRNSTLQKRAANSAVRAPRTRSNVNGSSTAAHRSRKRRRFPVSRSAARGSPIIWAARGRRAHRDRGAVTPCGRKWFLSAWVTPGRNSTSRGAGARSVHPRRSVRLARSSYRAAMSQRSSPATARRGAWRRFPGTPPAAASPICASRYRAQSVRAGRDVTSPQNNPRAPRADYEFARGGRTSASPVTTSSPR